MSKISKIKQFYVKNQFIIESDDVVIFQSYDSLIASYDKINKILVLDSYYWDYSRTTIKYLYRFINEYCSNIFAVKLTLKKQVKHLINNGYIILKDLNK